jgi:hypothetical protein
VEAANGALVSSAVWQQLASVLQHRQAVLSARSTRAKAREPVGHFKAQNAASGPEKNSRNSRLVKKMAGFINLSFSFSDPKNTALSASKVQDFRQKLKSIVKLRNFYRSIL